MHGDSPVTAASRGPARPQADLRAEPQVTAQRGQVVTGSRERAGTSAGGRVKVAGAKTGEHETGERETGEHELASRPESKAKLRRAWDEVYSEAQGAGKEGRRSGTLSLQELGAGCALISACPMQR